MILRPESLSDLRFPPRFCFCCRRILSALPDSGASLLLLPTLWSCTLLPVTCLRKGRQSLPSSPPSLRLYQLTGQNQGPSQAAWGPDLWSWPCCFFHLPPTTPSLPPPQRIPVFPPHLWIYCVPLPEIHPPPLPHTFWYILKRGQEPISDISFSKTPSLIPFPLVRGSWFSSVTPGPLFRLTSVCLSCCTAVFCVTLPTCLWSPSGWRLPQSPWPAGVEELR